MADLTLTLEENYSWIGGIGGGGVAAGQEEEEEATLANFDRPVVPRPRLHQTLFLFVLLSSICVTASPSGGSFTNCEATETKMTLPF